MGRSVFINIYLLLIIIVFFSSGCKKDIIPVEYDPCYFKEIEQKSADEIVEYETEYISDKQYLAFKDQHILIYIKNEKTFFKHFDKDLNEIYTFELQYKLNLNSVQSSEGILYWVSYRDDLYYINEYDIQTNNLYYESLPTGFSYLFFHLDIIDNKKYLSCFNSSLSEIDIYYIDKNTSELQFITNFKPPYIGSEISQTKIFKIKNDVILTTTVASFSKSFLFDFSLTKKDTVYKESFDYYIPRTSSGTLLPHNNKFIFLPGSNGNVEQVFIIDINNKSDRKAIDGQFIYFDDNYILIDKDNLYSLKTFEPFLDSEKYSDIYIKSSFISQYLASDSLYIYKRHNSGYSVEAINKGTGCTDKNYNLAKAHIYMNFDLKKLISLDEYNLRIFNLK